MVHRGHASLAPANGLWYNRVMKKIMKIITAILLVFIGLNHWIRYRARRALNGPDAHGKGRHSYRGRFGRVAYTVRGRGTPLLLIHGVGPGRNANEWSGFARLAESRHRVYALDLWGFGGSETPAMDYSAYLYAAQINEFIRRVIRSKTTVIASGHAAAYTAAACAVCPQHFEKLVAVSPVSARTPHCRWLYEVLCAPVLGTAVYNLLASRIMIFVYLKGLLHRAPVGFNTLVKRYYVTAHAGGPAARCLCAALLAGYLNVDFNQAAAQIKIPILTVWGQYDNPKKIRCQNSHGARVVIQNTGGLPHFENPLAFLSACDGFL